MKSVFHKVDKLYDNNPQNDWKLIKELEDDVDTPDASSRISKDFKWVNHFNKLSSTKLQFMNKNIFFSKILDNINRNHSGNFS